MAPLAFIAHKPDPDAEWLYFDEDGHRVPEGDPSARSQYLSDDPGRPDAEWPDPDDPPAMDRAA